MRVAVYVGIVVLLAFFASEMRGQTIEIKPSIPPRNSAPTTEGPAIRVNSDLVIVPVHVTNRDGVSLNGLLPESFSLFEDRTPQSIESFGNEDTPCSIGLVLDLSGSMSGKLNLASSTLHAFLETSNPEDEASLFTISTHPHRVSGFTNDFGSLQNRLMATDTGGATAFVDTLYATLDELRAAHYGRKAIVVISDGMDNRSRHSERELMRLIEEADVQIYTISVATWALPKKPIELTEERNGLSLLQSLADRSGGVNWTIRNYSEAPAVAEKVSRAIREQYILGYRPNSQADPGKWRSLQVRVNLPAAKVSARAGYYFRPE